MLRLALTLRTLTPTLLRPAPLTRPGLRPLCSTPPRLASESGWRSWWTSPEVRRSAQAIKDEQQLVAALAVNQPASGSVALTKIRRTGKEAGAGARRTRDEQARPGDRPARKAERPTARVESRVRSSAVPPPSDAPGSADAFAAETVASRCHPIVSPSPGRDARRGFATAGEQQDQAYLYEVKRSFVRIEHLIKVLAVNDSPDHASIVKYLRHERRDRLAAADAAFTAGRALPMISHVAEGTLVPRYYWPPAGATRAFYAAGGRMVREVDARRVLKWLREAEGGLRRRWDAEVARRSARSGVWDRALLEGQEEH